MGEELEGIAARSDFDLSQHQRFAGKPMTVFDAGARPMANAFGTTPNLAVYHNEPPRVPLDEKNPEHSATAARSMKLDFSASDLADEDELNDILWIAIKGTTPPPPVHSLFAR